MKKSDLMEYLKNFDDDAEVSIISANPKERKLYEVDRVVFLTNVESPVLGIEIGRELDMDAEMVAACEEDEMDGQLDLTDFPEVMPEVADD